MGSTLGKSGGLLPILGTQGGAGCSVVSSLTARLLAKQGLGKIAFLDALPLSYSSVPSALGLKPSRSLDQCEPTRDNLTFQMLESFFSVSPEGVFYIPLRQKDETPIPFAQTFQMIEKLLPWFDHLILDLSSFPNDQIIPWIEKCGKAVLLSKVDPASLPKIHQWEKRLLSAHLPVENFHLAFNQEMEASPIPKNPALWAKHFKILGSIPFLGADLSLRLMESTSLPSSVEKGLAPFVEKLRPILGSPGASPRQSSVSSVSQAPTLEQVYELHQKLLEALRRSGTPGDQAGITAQRESLEPKARELLAQLMPEMKIEDRETRQRLSAETLDLAFGLGPLEPLLRDGEITEVMVNGANEVFAERKGLLEKTTVRFYDEAQLRTIIERVLAPLGRRLDESQPYVDGRLPDGSRINAVIHPVSLDGPILTIRKFSKQRLTVEDLIRFGSLTREAADFLGACVKARKNILVSGGTGSGKTTLLNILSHFIPAGERIITIEDSAELQLSQEHVVRLEGRPANLEGKGLISIRDLVVNALRMRPDRIIVGEVRAGEALDMLQAMNTGHDGSLTTAHANSPRDVLARLETMVLFTGLELPLRAIREQISRAIHLVVQVNRLPGGQRAITQISEIQGMEGDVILTHDLFTYDEDQGLERRSFAPSFIASLNAAGYQWPGHPAKVKS